METYTKPNRKKNTRGQGKSPQVSPRETRGVRGSQNIIRKMKRFLHNIKDILNGRKRAPELTRAFIEDFFDRLGVDLPPTRYNYLKVLHARLDQMK